MSGEGKVENGKSVQEKFAAVNFGVAADIHLDFSGVKLPLGMREFAGRDRAVVHQVVVWAGLFHNFAGKSKGGSRSENHTVAAKAQACGSDHVIEFAGLGDEVVGATAGSDGGVIGATVEREVALRVGFSSCGIVCSFIGAKDVRAIVNLHGLMQFVNRAVFFLGDRTNQGGTLFHGLGLPR